MAQSKEAPAYISEPPPAPLPPIQVLTDAPPPKKKFPIPLWMIILIVVCFWLSGMATMAVIFLGNKNKATEVQTQPTPQSVVTVVITETPAPQKTTQKIVNSKRILTNNQFGYSIETPATWKTEDDGKQFWTYEEGATSRFEPQPYLFGRVLISYGSQTEFKIVQWFDLQFPPEFGDKKAPIKRKLYVNKNGVEMLETDVPDTNGRLRYYFIANKQIVTLSFNTTEDAEVNKKLQVLYGQIIDSVAVIKPSAPAPAK